MNACLTAGKISIAQRLLQVHEVPRMGLEERLREVLTRVGRGDMNSYTLTTRHVEGTARAVDLPHSIDGEEEAAAASLDDSDDEGLDFELMGALYDAYIAGMCKIVGNRYNPAGHSHLQDPTRDMDDDDRNDASVEANEEEGEGHDSLYLDLDKDWEALLQEGSRALAPRISSHDTPGSDGKYKYLFFFSPSSLGDDGDGDDNGDDNDDDGDDGDDNDDDDDKKKEKGVSMRTLSFHQSPTVLLSRAADAMDTMVNTHGITPGRL